MHSFANIFYVEEGRIHNRREDISTLLYADNIDNDKQSTINVERQKKDA